MSPGLTQILIVALIIIVLFGASRLGEIGKGLGEGIKSFKKGLSDGDAPPEPAPSDELTGKDENQAASGVKGAETDPAKPRDA